MWTCVCMYFIISRHIFHIQERLIIDQFKSAIKMSWLVHLADDEANVFRCKITRMLYLYIQKANRKRKRIALITFGPTAILNTRLYDIRMNEISWTAPRVLLEYKLDGYSGVYKVFTRHIYTRHELPNIKHMPFDISININYTDFCCPHMCLFTLRSIISCETTGFHNSKVAALTQGTAKGFHGSESIDKSEPRTATRTYNGAIYCNRIYIRISWKLGVSILVTEPTRRIGVDLNPKIYRR